MGTRTWSGKTYVKEGSDYAASHVRWEEAAEFCAKLSSKEAVTYRLPTEAEWEYACRGGTTTAYHFGDASRLGDYAWFYDNTQDAGEKYAHRVGQKKPNVLGLYDMHGNVGEWCLDWYDSGYYENSPTDDPAGPGTGSFRVYRGGGWAHTARQCVSSFRNWITPTYRFSGLGFRVAADLSGN